jgi:type II secretory pathway predicted ATPase ExeA
MYERHFRLETKPFAMSPDPAFLYPSAQHETGLTMLEYALESQAPFCVLTGEIGSGKTTLLRRFLRGRDDSITVGLISNTHARFRSIHPWAVTAFGLPRTDPSETAPYEALIEFIIGEYGKGRRALLVVDEAHNLSTDVLEELRLLSNVNSEKDVALQTFLIGQPELRDKLEQPALEQFAQRVSVDFHLGALTLADARAYIAHRLSVAGGDVGLFPTDVIPFIHARTRGIPRLINQLCDLSLVYAFAEQLPAVDLRICHLVLQDRKQLGAMALFGTRPAVASAGIDSGLGEHCG